MAEVGASSAGIDDYRVYDYRRVGVEAVTACVTVGQRRGWTGAKQHWQQHRQQCEQRGKVHRSHNGQLN